MILCYEHRKLTAGPYFFGAVHFCYATFRSKLARDDILQCLWKRLTSFVGDGWDRLSIISHYVNSRMSTFSQHTSWCFENVWLPHIRVSCPHFWKTEFSLTLPAINVTTVQNHIVFAALYTSTLYYVVLYSSWYIVYWITIINFIFIGERKIFNQITI